MTGVGVVKMLIGSDAVVEISKSSACGHDCASCGACSNPSYEITVSNHIGARVGDRVSIESSSAKILGLSFLLYIIPVFLMIIAAVICQEYSLGFFSILVFLSLGIMWFVLIRLANKRIHIKNTITKVLKD